MKFGFVVESSLKFAKVNVFSFASRNEAKLKINEYIDVFYYFVPHPSGGKLMGHFAVLISLPIYY
ncbi:MAG: hypothetical protein KAR42_01915 [candidate division Zixibacteria bacterium]|nr:hypothetical protein [candidate division Zixibacteria bacterium]